MKIDISTYQKVKDFLYKPYTENILSYGDVVIDFPMGITSFMMAKCVSKQFKRPYRRLPRGFFKLPRKLKKVIKDFNRSHHWCRYNTNRFIRFRY